MRHFEEMVKEIKDWAELDRTQFAEAKEQPQSWPWHKHPVVDTYVNAHPYQERIDELIAEYGYRAVADAFGIARRQYFYKFDEYTVEPESFDSDENPFDLNGKYWLYQAYCRWCGYWPALISTKNMNILKEYEDRVRHCHGEFFTLTVKRLHLSSAVRITLSKWDDNIHERWDEAGSVNENYSYAVDSSEYTMTDADFHSMHDQYQAKQIKALVLELLEHGEVKPEFIRAYTLCKTRSVTEDGWGPDVFVLSKADRAEIIQKLTEFIGAEEVAKCISRLDLDDAGVDLGIDADEKAPEYEYYYLRNADCRENGFAIYGEDLLKPLFCPDVNIEKYLLPTLELEKIENGSVENGITCDEDIPI